MIKTLSLKDLPKSTRLKGIEQSLMVLKDRMAQTDNLKKKEEYRAQIRTLLQTRVNIQKQG
jgi:hypothetical protein